MGLRPAYDKEAIKQANEHLDKWVGRIYLFWLIGVAAGLVKLKAEKLRITGVEYTISNPGAIQGLIFIGCLLCYVAAIGIIVIFSLQWSYPNRGVARRMIYQAAGSRRTLQNKSTREILIIKKLARYLVRLATGVMLCIFALPAAHILTFERDALWVALTAMFN